MKISTKGRYGLTLMISLAKREGQGNAGLIRSVRGAKGGYQLRVPADEIKAGDIIRLLEGPITIVESIESEPPAQKQLWLRMRDAVREVLDNTTLKYLADYVETDDKLDGYMFYI